MSPPASVTVASPPVKVTVSAISPLRSAWYSPSTFTPSVRVRVMVNSKLSPSMGALPASTFSTIRLPASRVLVKLAAGILPVAGIVPVTPVESVL